MGNIKSLSKPVRSMLFLGLVSSVVMALWIIGMSANSYLQMSSENKSSSQANSCQGITGVNHLVVIEKDVVAPAQLAVKKCDTVTVLNRDNQNRLMAFGQHEHHIEYNGHEETPLSAGESFTFTADTTGTYLLHDHEHDSTQLEFSVL